MLRKGQHFYIVNRCTLVSLQVEKECLQIFRIINNSLHRCQGQNWKLGSCPQPGSMNTVTQTASLPWEPPQRWPWGKGGCGRGDGNKESLAQQQDFQSFHTENPLNSVFTEPPLKLWAFLSSRMVSLKCFQPQPIPRPLLPKKLKSHKSNSLYPNQDFKSLSPKLYP